MQQTVAGLSRLGEMPRLTDGLLERGYGEDDVKGILGGNYMRVLRGIWK